MKIGTDGVLLGAWTSIKHNPFSALDIGAGTGVIYLMLAQRSHVEIIEAVEIDDDAYEQCAENFDNSPWNDRLFCYHASLIEYVEEIDDKYDIVVCNPPFYSEDYKSKNNSRDLARFQDAMPFDHLIYAVANLLSENGIFSVIIPNKEEDNLKELASKIGLYPNRILHLKGNPQSEVKRSLIEFAFQRKEVEISELVIENGRHNYTEDYKNLTKDFYLKM
ncbi:methyltransferase [Winogradskyella sp.]|uniref:tRNA1(Val) (adenine(37)-N6)-methyltransferase n=1 Tax=Winogradskyella sp. TaxID=1883156 RepID=UPI0025E04D49|nr:methyltransferase [Winogradskyella sp.]